MTKFKAKSQPGTEACSMSHYDELKDAKVQLRLGLLGIHNISVIITIIIKIEEIFNCKLCS